MFDDIFSSSRGPGVIGTLLAVFVLAGFCGLGLAVFNNDAIGPSKDSQVTYQQSEIKDLKKKIAKKSATLAKYEGFREQFAEVALQKKLLTMRTERVSELSSKKSNMVTTVAESGEEFEGYKAQYRKNEREFARGENVDLSETKGAKFKNVKILKVNAVEMRVSLSSGPKGVPYTELPLPLQDRFQFDEDEAEAFKGAMGKARDRRNKDLAKWEKEQQGKKIAARAADKANSIAQKRRQISSKQAYIKRKRAAARKWESKADEYGRKAAAARSKGNMSMDTGNARKAENTAKRHHRAADAGERDIKRLRQEIKQLKRELAK